MSISTAILAALSLLLLTANVAQADHSEDADSCIPVRAVLKASLVTDPCPPVNLCTTGTLSRSWLSGSSVFTGTAAAPAAGLPNVPPTTLSYAGTMVVQTFMGNLELDNVGLFDTAPQGDGDFSQIGTVVGGTGIFASASGTLFFYGQNGSTPGSLFSRVKGKVCF